MIILVLVLIDISVKEIKKENLNLLPINIFIIYLIYIDLFY
jgi:hypothetical protein